jgi:hypothetical protein
LESAAQKARSHCLHERSIRNQIVRVKELRKMTKNISGENSMGVAEMMALVRR